MSASVAQRDVPRCEHRSPGIGRGSMTAPRPVAGGETGMRPGAPMRRAPAGPCAPGKLLHCALVAALLALAACGGGGGAPPPPGGPPPGGQPPPQPPPGPEPPGAGGFVPDRETVVGFPALLHGGSPDEEREARAEAARVSAMHGRGGTGRGEIVGTIEAGAHPDHPDLAGQFAHVCAMGDCDDGRSELNRSDASPRLDTQGHGTVVNGIVAAKKNGRGVYGVAHEARIASYGNTHTVVYPWGNRCPPGVGCPPGVAEREHQWGPVFDEQIARGVDWMRSLGVGAVNNSWSRTWPWARERGVTAATIREIMAETLPAFERYVAAGGVAVWAAGNGQSFHPAEEAVLPRYFPHLEKGWLAVVGVDGDGRISPASWRCGVAADWCLAAPMVLVTTDRNGRWNVAGGTSIAAPYVTAGLAALKSMFPNLSYQDVRARILATADRTGRYGNSATYGRGRLDLDAASRPVDGTNFALGVLDTGAVAPTAGAYAALPEGAVGQYLAGRTIVVLDGFQRAPFEVPLEAFAAPRSPYLTMDDLGFAPIRERRGQGGSTAVAAAGGGTLAHGLSAGRWSVGTGRGPRVASSLAALAGTPLASGDYRMSRAAVGVALGFSGEAGDWRAVAASGGAAAGDAGFGISGWSPETVLAASFAPHGGTDAFGLSLAPDLGRPMGWQGSGALALEGDGVALGWRRNIAARETVRLDLTGRLAHLALRDGPLLRFGDALVAAAGLEASVALHPSVTLRARLGTERPVSGATGRLRAAVGVDESGRIAWRDVALDGRDLLRFDRAALGLGIAAGPDASVGFGIAAMRDGFGRTEALAGLRMEARF